MERTAREIADSFEIRCSAIHEVVGGTIGLTDIQQEKLNGYQERYNGVGKPLTDKQEAERVELFKKLNNPELPEGLKTHCKKWLKENLFNRREILNNKYVNKGNETEEEGFTLAAVELKLGMVYKNTERRRNGIVSGECDLHHEGVTHDNKSSWSLDTFPMFETSIPDIKYWWQLQGYSMLWPSKELSLNYTLVNSSYESVEKAIKWADTANEKYIIAKNMVFTQKEFDLIKDHFFSDATLTDFVEIPAKKRIKPFKFKPEPEAVRVITERSALCKEYIYALLINSGYK